MKINVDEIVQRVLPWECELTIGGQVHRVRPPSLADVDGLKKIEARTLGGAAAAEFVESLFEDPRPKLQDLPMPQFNLVLRSVLGYIGEYLSKKNADLLLEAAGLTPSQPKTGTSGNSSPPFASPALASTPSVS